MSVIPLNAESPIDQWLAAIEACHPAEIDLGLDRMREVAQRLPIDIEKSLKVVVGGTNGKGTSIRLLESILIQAGYSVGTYTSPHFLYYNERITLQGNPVSDVIICNAFYQIEQARQAVPLTYFEYGTLAALLIFSEALPDVLLLEVGLGGRLDSVNLVDADISLVTTVALDHTDWLGPDREAIGYEKAGIFRPNCPAVCGDPDAPVSLIQHAEKIGAYLLRNQVDYDYQLTENTTWSWQGRSLNGDKVTKTALPIPKLPLQNAAAILQVLELLPVTVSDQQLAYGLVRAQLTGRMQRAQVAGLPCLLDVAHNPESAAYLANYLAKHLGSKVHLVLGMLIDKDIQQVCQLLAPVVDHWHLVSLSTPRGASSAQLRDVILALGEDVSSITEYDSVKIALSELPDTLESSTHLVIAGSFFTVTDALPLVERVDGE